MIKWTVLDTPPGPFCVVSDADGVVLASGWVSDVDELLLDVAPELAGEQRREDELADIREAVDAYYQRGDFSALDQVEVRAGGTEFLREAWAALRRIPPGEPVGYREFAALAGRPAATRAAASACARNRTGLFVPCHRVVRSDGSVGQFRWGPEIKRWHLTHEHTNARSFA